MPREEQPNEVENEVTLFGLDYDLCPECGERGFDCDCGVGQACPACDGAGHLFDDIDDCDVCMGMGIIQ